MQSDGNVLCALVVVDHHHHHHKISSKVQIPNPIDEELHEPFSTCKMFIDQE
jgi:hypothetical protein